MLVLVDCEAAVTVVEEIVEESGDTPLQRGPAAVEMVVSVAAVENQLLHWQIFSPLHWQ